MVSRPADYDVLVVGGGPGGSSAATFLARGGLTVALAEREAFPRFQVGESLLPANHPGPRTAGRARRGEGPRVPGEVRRVLPRSGDGSRLPVLLPRGQAVAPVYLRSPAGRVRQDPARPRGAPAERDALAARHGRARGLRRRRRHGDRHRGRGRARQYARASSSTPAAATPSSPPGTDGGAPVEGLGKVALFAHFRGGKRWPGREYGNIRIFVFESGWFWYIPFTDGTTSVGCVLHARTVRGRDGNLETLYDSLIARCRGLADALDGAPRTTPVRSAANFSYRTDPAIGDRFVCVGDAIAFLDPIFSSGVYIATQSAELASAEILGGVPGEPLPRPTASAPTSAPSTRACGPSSESIAELLRPGLHGDVPQAARVRRHGGRRDRRAGRWRVPPFTLRMRVSLSRVLHGRPDQSLGPPPPGPSGRIPLQVVGVRLTTSRAR